MTKLPAVTGRQLLDALQKAGFQVRRQKGSHVYIEHEDGRSTVVPVHQGETIGRGLLRKIMRDCEIPRDTLLTLLK
jgi:predicted RNA binding protein YcfA (HicA-like mRNA interferase family)